MASLAQQIAAAPGQPSSVRIGIVDSVQPMIVLVQGVQFTDVGFISDYVPQTGDVVALLGQSSASGTDPTSWLCLGRVSSEPAERLFMTHLQRSAAQTIPTGVFTAMIWDTVLFDNMNGFPAGSTTDFTVPFDGVYQVDAKLTFVANATNQRQGLYFYNGSSTETFVSMNAVAAIGTRYALPTFYLDANVGDRIDVRAFQNTGANLNTEAAAGVFPQFWVRYLGKLHP